MQGFDPKFVDLPDYILKITKEIWEDRGLATLNDYYGDDLPMRFASGIVHGKNAVITGTMATLAEFPDRQLLGEDVIWSGNDQDGYLSSHRLVTMGTHTGHGFFGKPTGKRFTARAIADCYCINNQITDEWLIRDSSAILLDLGKDPKKFARKLIAREGGPENCTRPFTPQIDRTGPYKGRGNDNERGAQLADMLQKIMAADFAHIPKAYDRAVEVNHPGKRGGWGWPAADAAWLQLRSAFPSATFSIDHQIGREDSGQPPRAAIRWSLNGRHDGYGTFGKPSGAPVHIMGFTHAEWGPYGLKREFTLFDDVSIWKQIHLHAG